MRSADRYVLDSFALLAYLEDEQGAAAVQDIFTRCEDSWAGAWLSIVNYGEALYITEREQGLPAAEKVIAAVDQLPIQVVMANRDRTFAAAHVKVHHPVSYADAFAIALAREFDAQIVTGDPEFQRTEELAPVLWIEQ